MGYAFKHDEQAIVSIAAALGYDWSVISKNIAVYAYGYSREVTIEANTFAFYVGADLAATIRLSEKVGFFGPCLFAVPITGFEIMKASYNGYSNSENYDINAGGFFIQPALGISITVD